MIVCDAHVAFLAIVGAVQFTPETLATNANELMVIIRALAIERGTKERPVEGKLERYLHELGDPPADVVLELICDPDPQVLQILGPAPVLRSAAEFVRAYKLTPRGAVLVGMAKQLSAELLIGEYETEPWATACKAEGVTFRSISRVSIDDEQRMVAHRTDRRRPNLTLPTSG
jgi:hypothetical protein